MNLKIEKLAFIFKNKPLPPPQLPLKYFKQKMNLVIYGLMYVLKTIHINTLNFLGPIPASIFSDLTHSEAARKTEVKNVSTSST